MSAISTEDLTQRFYSDLWNRWDTSAAPAILGPDFRFRGSLGAETRGIDGFLTYVATIRDAFPDFTNTIETLITDGDQAAARLTYTGTHSGQILGFSPTGKVIRYSGAAFFFAKDDLLRSAWVLGDLDALKRQLA
ncbi:MAG: ester cyclase [Alphaproteobacteria bacterium]